MPRSRGFNFLHSGERDRYGVIATLEHDDGTGTTVQEFPGAVKGAMRECADYCDRHNLRVVSLSTPATIHGDLAGRSHQISSRPEFLYLGIVGRIDLLHRRVRKLASPGHKSRNGLSPIKEKGSSDAT